MSQLPQRVPVWSPGDASAPSVDPCSLDRAGRRWRDRGRDRGAADPRGRARRGGQPVETPAGSPHHPLRATHHCSGSARRGRLRRPERVPGSRARPCRLGGRGRRRRSRDRGGGGEPPGGRREAAQGERVRLAGAHQGGRSRPRHHRVRQRGAVGAPRRRLQQGGARLRDGTATTPCASRLRGCSDSTPARCS